MESNVVGIKFKPVGKIYFFDAKNLVLEDLDGVIVETERGIEYGEVVAGEKPNEEEIKDLKPVLRKATEKDFETLGPNLAKAAEYGEEANKLIKKANLEMKLIDSEVTFDGSKVIFTFTSDGRVDFRDLVKDLASKLRARIELRQVGARDESKIIGGLGPCGRPVCCANHMRDFNKVSIKMAKTQGLALNPNKINGLCNRLMCCLAYEDEHYGETMKVMPRIGKKVSTPMGEGIAVYNNLLKKVVSVRFLNEDGIVSMEQFSLDQIVNLGGADEEPKSKCDVCPKKMNTQPDEQIIEMEIIEEDEIIEDDDK